MNVLLTVGLLVAVAVWAAHVYRRLVMSRTRITLEWRHIDRQLKRRDELAAALALSVAGATGFEPVASRVPPEASPEARALQDELAATARTLEGVARRYAEAVTRYNATLHTLSGQLVAGLAGFRPAALFEVTPVTQPTEHPRHVQAQ